MIYVFNLNGRFTTILIFRYYQLVNLFLWATYYYHHVHQILFLSNIFEFLNMHVNITNTISSGSNVHTT